MNNLFADLYQVADEYLAPTVQDPANRGRSWDRCYSFFQQYRQWDQQQRNQNRELACLHLGFYLASWGMFRGSGPLIHKDYTIYGGMMDLLLDEQYAQLWNLTLFENLLAGNEQIPENDPQVALVFSLADEIRSYIDGLRIIRNHRDQPEHARATPTQITKITMGTLGCTPAYDRYFCRGLTTCGIHRCGAFTPVCFARLLNICREHNLWHQLQDRSLQCYGVTYPIMRVVDLYFWVKGFQANQDAD